MKLRTRADSLPVSSAGFSMVELMIVVALIVVMAAVGLPNLMGYLRQAKVRGAMQQVAGELQAARNKAIAKNTNSGVAFAIIDADTYRFYVSDVTGPSLGPIQQLPAGVTFTAGTLPGFAFTSLGAPVAYGTPPGITGAPAQATLCPTPSELRLCTDQAGGDYIRRDPATGIYRVELIENATQLTRWVEVAPGGRVVTQR